MKASCLILLASTLACHGAATTPTNFLDVVRRYADTMIERERDCYSPQKSGLLLSALDRTTLAPLKVRPAPPGGIRRETRLDPPTIPEVEMRSPNLCFSAPDKR